LNEEPSGKRSRVSLSFSQKQRNKKMLEPKKKKHLIVMIAALVCQFTNIELGQGVKIDGLGRQIRIKGLWEADLALDWPREIEGRRARS
jgi:hypothetical protein